MTLKAKENESIFLDTETCGLHAMPVLIQYAVGDGEIQLFSPWTRPIIDSLQLVEYFVEHDIIGFNLVFDLFHLIKLYNVFRLYPDHNAIPERVIDDLADLEMEARDGPCLKFKGVMDVFLFARKTSYQQTMERGDIRIRRVPTPLAWQLASELEKRIPLKDIYFARKKDKTTKWNVYDIKDNEDNIDANFKDIVLKFAPSSGLKALAVDALGVKQDNILLFTDVEIDKKLYPSEVGYAPFAKAMGGDRTDWRGAWPEKIRYHISHWQYNDLARKYAADDVKYTRELYKYFGSPPINDNDSILTNCVAACRWKGYKVDIDKLKALKVRAQQRIQSIPVAPNPVRYYVNELLDPTERLGAGGSTAKLILEELAELTVPCPQCNHEAEMSIVKEEVNRELVEEFDAPDVIINTVISKSKKSKGCKHCSGKGFIKHKAAVRAQEVLDARASQKEIELYDKLILAGRFHASFKVIGTLSSRLSGADKLNPQAINKSKDVRGCFPLAWEGMILEAGDYAGFEVTLAEACYNDPDLRKDLLTCEKCDNQMEFKQDKNDFICMTCGSNSGKKVHALFGTFVYPGMTYEEIKATSGTHDDKYTRCKSAVFAMMYGGEGPTLKSRLGVELEIANKAFNEFGKRYKGVGLARQRIVQMFQSMRQPDGIGSKVIWNEPADKIESMLGFPRYFTLENMICKALFELANKPPRSWQDIKVKVVRRDRIQTGSGATQSALYAAAFNLQSSNMRAAANHEIQSTGAQITKATQVAVWNIQPNGIHPFHVMPMNIHDEIQCPCIPEVEDKVKQIVMETVESFRWKIPLIKMDWQTNLNSWADKS